MCIVYVPSYILHLDEKMRQVLRLIGVVVSTFGDVSDLKAVLLLTRKGSSSTSAVAF